MKDRVPKYPGRVKMVPVSGQANTYDMQMADEPTEQGTPPTKANLLPDSVANQYWPTGQAPANPVVKDVLGVLGTAVLSDWYYWKKYLILPSPILSSKKNRYIISGTDDETRPVTLQYADNVVVNNGVVALKNPTTITITYQSVASLPNLLCNKYFIVPNSGNGSENDGGMLCYGDSTPLNRWHPSDNAYVSKNSSMVTAGVRHSFQEILKAKSGDAYPKGTIGDKFYEFIGGAMNFVKIETGSYVGTGTYGARNPNVLTFGFEPKVVIILATDNVGNGWGILLPDGPLGLTNSNRQVTVTKNGNMVSWYDSNGGNGSSQNQLNSGTYRYVAIG